jgi:hypothetical protein
MTEAPVAQGADAPVVAELREPATQGLTSGRNVKFLNVFVVSGGIRMPGQAASIDNATAANGGAQ